MHILFVCTGNTCRSPMAANLMQSFIQKRQLDWSVSSAGLFVEPGAPMASQAQAALAELGLEVGPHQAQPVTQALMDEADVVLTMTGSHAEQLRRQFPHATGKIYPFAHFAVGTCGDKPDLQDDALTVGYDIPDPFGGPKDTYDRCAKHLQGLTERAVERLLQKQAGNGSGAE